MSDKDIVIEAVRKLPESATLNEISEEIAILAAIKEGEKDADEGRIVSHEEVKKRFAAWSSK
jgi:predicted transcriptional regulator